MKKVVWIGLATSETIFEELVDKGYRHSAAHVAQKNLIEGIQENVDVNIDVISGFMMPSFPNSSELITQRKSWVQSGNSQGIGVPSINVRYVDVLARTYFMRNECIKWAQKHLNDEVTIIVYTASYPYIKAALEIKERVNNSKVYLIIPDLPQYMELNPTKLKKFLKDMNWKSLYSAIKKCDGWILFTKHMANFLELPPTKCITMEGSVNVGEIQKKIKKKNNSDNEDKIILMYSGSLELKYGIPELLNAFSNIHDNKYELWISGKGSGHSMIEEYQLKDSRIKYFGFLNSRKQVLELQNQATMLMNMRMPSEKASAYCFPSKIFEYLLTGKPVLSFRLPGIPNEYYDYLVEMKSKNTEDIKNTILYIGSMNCSERNKIGKRGKDFVINEKNNYMQAKRICAFIGLY